MGAKMKIGDCYCNALLVPFKVVAFVDSVAPVEGEPFAAVIVDFAWPKDDYESTIEVVERSIVEAWVAHERTRVISEVDLRCLRKYQGLPLEIKDSDKDAVEALWSLYGNAGTRYTKGNHEFIRCYLEGQPEKGGHFQPTRQCVEDFKKVLCGDYSMLPEGTRKTLEGQQAMSDWMSRKKDGDRRLAE